MFYFELHPFTKFKCSISPPSAENLTQGLTHARQVVYHGATAPAPQM
jgi:hypothetical protein